MVMQVGDQSGGYLEQLWKGLDISGDEARKSHEQQMQQFGAGKSFLESHYAGGPMSVGGSLGGSYKGIESLHQLANKKYGDIGSVNVGDVQSYQDALGAAGKQMEQIDELTRMAQEGGGVFGEQSAFAKEMLGEQMSQEREDILTQGGNLKQSMLADLAGSGGVDGGARLQMTKAANLQQGQALAAAGRQQRAGEMGIDMQELEARRNILTQTPNMYAGAAGTLSSLAGQDLQTQFQQQGTDLSIAGAQMAAAGQDVGRSYQRWKDQGAGYSGVLTAEQQAAAAGGGGGDILSTIGSMFS
jgi:hypothetical protein